MKKAFEDVKEFHKVYGAPIADKPNIIPRERRVLRVELIKEELNEFTEAIWKSDIVGVADALADIIYVCIGAAIEFGIPLPEVWDEVQASNMSKLDENGKPILREDGKVLKGPNYFKPNIEKILTEKGKN